MPGRPDLLKDDSWQLIYKLSLAGIGDDGTLHQLDGGCRVPVQPCNYLGLCRGFPPFPNNAVRERHNRLIATGSSSVLSRALFYKASGVITRIGGCGITRLVDYLEIYAFVAVGGVFLFLK